MVASNILKSAALAAGVHAAAAAAASRLERRAGASVPQFVLDYAPLNYLHHQEVYYPADLQAQLDNTEPEINYTVVSDAPSPLTLDNLNQLNSSVYLTSKDNVTTNPAWLQGVKPDCAGKTNGAASTTIIVNDKGNGTVDAFYMYFYAFDWGGIYLDGLIQAGDHVGDWEHNMVRFEDGSPTYVWYSQHNNGEAFAYDVLLKSGLRPLNYVANGTHANYATSGTHDHTIPDLNLPDGLLNDYTDGPDDGGALWDPLLSAYFYNYTNATGTPTFTALGSSVSSTNSSCASNSTSANVVIDAGAYTPTNWLLFEGMWGDEEYPESDPRQVTYLDGLFTKYVSGPTGPIDKQLDRSNVCPDNGYLCILRWILGP